MEKKKEGGDTLRSLRSVGMTEECCPNGMEKEESCSVGGEETKACSKNKRGTVGAGMRSREKKSVKDVLKKRLSAKRLALMGVFVALSYAVSWLEIPLFPAAPYLKLDFGNVFILLISLLLGPVEGVVVCVLKESLRMIGSSSGIVGEIANVSMTSAYILLPSILYQFRKGLKTVIPALSAACIIGTGVALVVNRFITFPMYMGSSAAAVFADAFWFIVAFNLIKTVSVGLLTVLLYKRLSNFLKKMKI